MLTLLDRYILKKFFSTFFLAVGLTILVAIVIDISEKIDDFIETKATLKELVFDYYIYFIPYLYNLFSHLFIFLAVILMTSKMAGNSEIIAILSSGISYKRLLRPFITGAIFLGVLTYFLNSWAIPESDKKRVDFQNHHLKGRKNDNNWRNELHWQTEKGVYLYLEVFNYQDSAGHGFTLERFDGLELKSKIQAERFFWNRQTHTWAITNYIMREFIDSTHEGVKTGDQMDISLNFNPDDVFRRNDEVGVLNQNELNEFIRSGKVRGVENLDFYEVEKYRRIAFPFATIILTIIGVAVSSRKVRGGLGLHVGIGILIGASYSFIAHFANTFATSGNLPPVIAVWLPNTLYIFLAYFLYRLAPK